MNLRAGTGWQTTLTDLALILFMITASALSAMHEGTAAPPSPQAEPMAVWRSGPQAPPLDAWLAEQPRDPRQMLTIRAAYAPGGQGAALDEAIRIARAAGSAGMAARIVVEPGAGGTSATLAYDRPPERLARALQ
jgi:hypothetical protein